MELCGIDRGDSSAVHIPSGLLPEAEVHEVQTAPKV